MDAVAESDGEEEIDELSYSSPEETSVSLYEFVGGDAQQLSFPAGATIVIDEEVDNGWWKGSFEGKSGWFPANYVKSSLNSAYAVDLQGLAPSHDVAIVCHEYNPEQTCDITLKVGQIGTILERRKGGWWLGEFQGRRGLLPATHIRFMDGCPPQVAGEPTAPAIPKPKKPSKRQLVMNEILGTELGYVDSLAAMVEFVIQAVEVRDSPLKREILDKCCSVRGFGLMPLFRPEIAVIFNNFEQLRKLNTLFLGELQMRIEGWSERDAPESEQCLGDIFVRYAPLFRMYGQYASNHDAARSFVAEISAGKEWAVFWQGVTSSTTAFGAFGVESLLIKPVQRVPRYRLLLAELIKATPTSHIDYPALKEGMKEVESAAMFVNETIRLREQMDKLVELQKSFQGKVDLVTTGRYLIREGELTKVCRSWDKKYYWHLFNDALIYSDQSALGLKIHRVIDLEGDELSVTAIPDDDAHSNAFQIASRAKSFIVFAETPLLKTQWMADIRKALRILLTGEDSQKPEDDRTSGFEGGSQAPVWKPDGTSNTCQICGGKFSIVNRRHHCRSCGVLCCGKCSSARLVLDNINDTAAVRVCDPCATRFREGRSGGALRLTVPAAESNKCFRVRIKVLSCTGMSRVDGAEPSSFWKVSCNGKKFGESTTVKDTRNPTWKDAGFLSFPVKKNFGAVQFGVEFWSPKKKGNVFLGRRFLSLGTACVGCASHAILGIDGSSADSTVFALPLQHRPGRPGEDIDGSVVFSVTFRPPEGILESASQETVLPTDTKLVDAVRDRMLDLLPEKDDVELTPDLLASVIALQVLFTRVLSVLQSNRDERVTDVRRVFSEFKKRPFTQIVLEKLKGHSSVLESVSKGVDEDTLSVLERAIQSALRPEFEESPSAVVDEEEVSLEVRSAAADVSVYIEGEGRAALLQKLFSEEKEYVQTLQTLESAFVDPLLDAARSGALSFRTGDDRESTGPSAERRSTASRGPRKSVTVSSTSWLGGSTGKSDVVRRLNQAPTAVFLNGCKQLLVVHSTLWANLVGLAKEIGAPVVRHGSHVVPGTSRSGTDGSSTIHVDGEALCIGKLFSKFAPLLEIYGSFANARDMSQETLRSGKFATFIAALAARAKGKMDVYIRRAMERIPWYIELLQSISGATEGDHPDAAPLQQGLIHLNGAKRVMGATIEKRRNYEKVRAVQASIVDLSNLVRQGRELIREGVLGKVCRRKVKDFRFWLFNDCLLYGHALGMGRFKHHRTLELITCEASNVPDEPTSIRISSQQKSFVVRTQNASGKEEWIRDLQLAIRNCKASSGTDSDVAVAPVWVPNSGAHLCSLCGESFTFFVRRHHCRRCGALVCGKCSTHRMILPHLNATKRMRVCGRCAEEISSGGLDGADGGVVGEGVVVELGEVFDRPLPVEPVPERPAM